MKHYLDVTTRAIDKYLESVIKSPNVLSNKNISRLIRDSVNRAYYKPNCKNALDFLQSLPGRFYNSFDLLVRFNYSANSSEMPFYLTIHKMRTGLTITNLRRLNERN